MFPNEASDVSVSAGQTGVVNKAMKSLARAEDISQVNKLHRQIPSCIPLQGEARSQKGADSGASHRPGRLMGLEWN